MDARSHRARERGLRMGMTMRVDHGFSSLQPCMVLVQILRVERQSGNAMARNSARRTGRLSRQRNGRRFYLIWVLSCARRAGDRPAASLLPIAQRRGAAAR